MNLGVAQFHHIFQITVNKSVNAEKYCVIPYPLDHITKNTATNIEAIIAIKGNNKLLNACFIVFKTLLLFGLLLNLTHLFLF